MTDSTKAINSIESVNEVAYLKLPVAASENLFRGTMLAWNADGGLEPLRDSVGQIYGGLCSLDADNSAGDLGVIDTELQTPRFIIVAAVSPVNGWLGNVCYAVNDKSVTGDASAVVGLVVVGRVLNIVKTGTDGKVLVDTLIRS